MMAMGGRWAWLLLVGGCRFGFSPLPAHEHPANHAFVTSTVHTGKLSGLAGADQICATVAAEGGLDGRFVAWLSTDDTTAVSRIAGSRGWVLVDGTPIADQPEDLEAGAILSPLVLDEYGADTRVTSPVAWTGSAARQNCGSWTQAESLASGRVGDLRIGGRGFIDAGTDATCNTPLPLICLEVGKITPTQIAAAEGRHAFVSATPWSPNAGGVASADAACSGEATQAGLPGTYLALLPDAAGAAARFDLTGPPWIRSDGAPLTDTARELVAGQLRRNFLDRTAAGDRVAPATTYWAGDPIAPSTPCAGWTSTVGSARIGEGMFTDGRFFDLGPAACADSIRRLLCLQQ
jgi:hypothetical protein